MAQKKSLIPIIELERDLYKNETLDSGEITSGTYHIPVIKYNEGKKEIVNVNLSDVYEKASFDELQQQIDELESDKMDKFNLSDYLTSDALDDYVTSGDFNSSINDLQEQIDNLNSDIDLLSDALDDYVTKEYLSDNYYNSGEIDDLLSEYAKLSDLSDYLTSDALDDYVTKETPISIKYSEFEDGSDMENSDFTGRGYIGIQKHVEESDLDNPQSYNWIKNDSLFSAGAFETISANKTLSLERNTIRSLIVSADNITITFKKDFIFSGEDRAFKQIIKIIKPMNYNITYKFKDTANPDPDKSVGYFNVERRIGRNNNMGAVATVSRIALNEITLAGFNYQNASFEFITVTITANSTNAESNLGFDIIQIDVDSIATASWTDPS